MSYAGGTRLLLEQIRTRRTFAGKYLIVLNTAIRRKHYNSLTKAERECLDSLAMVMYGGIMTSGGPG
jgi:hypothetical protein